jgi:hypothetical protein
VKNGRFLGTVIQSFPSIFFWYSAKDESGKKRKNTFMSPDATTAFVCVFIAKPSIDRFLYDASTIAASIRDKSYKPFVAE